LFHVNHCPSKGAEGTTHIFLMIKITTLSTAAVQSLEAGLQFGIVVGGDFFNLAQRVCGRSQSSGGKLLAFIILFANLT